MASMGGGYLDAAPLVRIIRGGGYLNKQLQAICVGEGLGKVGVKADLQNRIIDRIQKHADNNDVARFERLKRMIEDPHSVDGSQYGYPPVNHPPNGSAAGTSAAQNNYGGSANMRGGMNAWRGNGHSRLEFKESPYFEIQQQLGEPTPCDVMTNHRHTVKIPVRPADHPILSRVNREPSLRVMVFCAAEPTGKQDISFPHQSELKVNGGEIKANLRGLKNKPGSTRPVDITNELRLNIAQYSNSVEMTYALTNKKYYVALYVVKTIPVADLVKKLENGRRITEKLVLDEMASKARDADIVATATVLSLKCPLSTLRISLPCRSISCKHNQCFDALSYLQLQEQGPTWLCPLCNNPAPFNTLAVDEYVKNILQTTSKSTDQVTIQPDGRWETHSKVENLRASRNGAGADSDSDDDLVEITKTGTSVRLETPRSFPSLNGAGHSVSREQSAASSMAPPSSNKGKRTAEVIDLTSSGDEDEEPLARAPKRQQTSHSVFGFSTVPAYRPGSQNLPPMNGYGAPRP